MAKIHFWTRLMALPRPSGTDGSYQCTELPCAYTNNNQTIVAGHLAVTHKVVFRIALDLFPDFRLPELPVPEEEITIVPSPSSMTIVSPKKRPAPESEGAGRQIGEHSSHSCDFWVKTNKQILD